MPYTPEIRLAQNNDRYGEHDFGAVEHGGVKIFWKIDYRNAYRSS
jgi:Protein of unknown function (DUF3768)